MRAFTTVLVAAHGAVLGAPLALLVATRGDDVTLSILFGIACVGVPLAIVIADMAIAIPATGGTYAWVRVAFGPGWGFSAAWLRVIVACTDAGIAAAAVAWFVTATGAATSFAGTLARDVPTSAVVVAALAVGALFVGTSPASAWWLGLAGTPALLVAVLLAGEATTGWQDWAGTAMGGAFGGALLVRGLDSIGASPTTTGPSRQDVLAAATGVIVALVVTGTAAIVADRIESWPLAAVLGAANGPIRGAAVLVFLVARMGVAVAMGARTLGALAHDRYVPLSLALGADGGPSRAAVVVVGVAALACALVPVTDVVAAAGIAVAATVAMQAASMLVVRSRSPRLPRGVPITGGVPGRAMVAALPTTAVAVATIAVGWTGGIRWAAVAFACLASAPVAWVAMTLLYRRGRPNRVIPLASSPWWVDPAWPGTPEVAPTVPTSPFDVRVTRAVPPVTNR